MKLTKSETDKLVTILNHMVEELGYDVETDGFIYDDSLEIQALAGDDVILFEEGLDFLLSENGIEYSNE